MELTRDQLLEIIDANDGNLNTTQIPIDTIPEDIKIPGELKVEVSSGGKIHRIPAITVGLLLIACSSVDEICIEVASGFQADGIYITGKRNTSIIFGNDIHIVNNLRVEYCKRLVVGDRLVVGRDISLRDISDGVEFGQYLCVGRSITRSGYHYLDPPLFVKLSKDSEISFLNAGKEPGSYFDLQGFDIKRLPTGSKFYCSISCSSSDLEIDKDVYIAGNLTLQGLDARSFHFQNALHIDGVLNMEVNGGEVYIPGGSQLGGLDVRSRPDAPVTYLRFGDGVHVKNEVNSLGMTRLINIPSQFRVDSNLTCTDASVLAEVAPDAYLGGGVKLPKYPLEHWSIKDNPSALDLAESKIRTLERGATVCGDLVLNGSSIKELVEVTVEGNLMLDKSAVERLTDIAIEGDLHICNCPSLKGLTRITVKGVICVGGTTPLRVLKPEHLARCTHLILTFAEDGDFRQAFKELNRLFDGITRSVQLKACYFTPQPCFEFQFA